MEVQPDRICRLLRNPSLDGPEDMDHDRKRLQCALRHVEIVVAQRKNSLRPLPLPQPQQGRAPRLFERGSNLSVTKFLQPSPTFTASATLHFHCRGYSNVLSFVLNGRE